MKTLKKIVLICLAVVLVGILSYAGYYVIHYKMYDDYKKSYVTYEYQEGTTYQAMSDSSPKVEGMDLINENDNLKLYANTQTGEVAVYDKRNDSITYSNPQNSEDDPIANETNKSLMKSQLGLSYYTPSRGLATMNSFDSSTKLGQIQVESIPNGVRFIYTIGDLTSKTGLVPTKVLEERMKEITSVMDEKAAKYILSKYVLNDGVYEIMEATKTKQATLRKMNAYLEESGYTEADYEADSEAAGAEDSIPVYFVIPIEYTLGDDYIEVNVPTAQIEENGGGSIYGIDILSYFAAAGADENGYILVPNGSGSIIHFNNGKTNASAYSQYLYGLDPLNANINQVQRMEEARLPLWGIQNSKSTILSTIESGDSLAIIDAGVAGKISSYNYVYAGYLLRGSETLSMAGSTGNESDLPVVEPSFTKVDLRTRYSFLTKEYSGYSGMANYYRERLIKEGVLTPGNTAETMPLYLDILGGVRREEYTLGVQYSKVYPMTTFKQAKKIAEYFVDQGITPIMNYQGWFNGGYYHDVADTIKGLGKLGGKGNFEDLAEYLKSNQGKLYGDVQFQKVTYGSKGYSNSEESSRYYASGFPVTYGVKNPKTLTNDYSMGYRDRVYHVLSPRFLPRYVSKFADKIEKYDITGISLRDLGSILQSDKKRTGMIDRQQAMNIVKDALSTLNDSGKELMISSPNSYAWNYADDLINVPTTDTEFFITDADVPFYEMLIHGSIDYCGSSVNLSANYDYNSICLNLVEYGAAPHFTFSWKDTSELKYTSLNNLYNTSFNQTNEQKATGISAFREDAVQMFNDVSSVLNKVMSSKIIQHEILDSGVRKVTYDNGVIVYVNRTDSDVSVDGITVYANDYAVKEAQE